jgi:hypothetical protein
MKEKPILEYALRVSGNQRIGALECHDGEADSTATRLVCPLCGEDVHFARMHDRAHRPHFVHVAGERARCPLVNSTLTLTSFMTIHPYDARLGKQRRSEFVEHWQQHFAEIRRYAPAFSVTRFIHTIDHADVLRIWSCATLVQRDIPYIFLALSSFITENRSSAHPTWLHFFFDASITDIADLRKPEKNPPRFFRLRYRASPHSMFPNARHLLEWTELSMSGDFLCKQAPPPMASEVFTFAEFVKLRPLPRAET